MILTTVYPLSRQHFKRYHQFGLVIKRTPSWDYEAWKRFKGTVPLFYFLSRCNVGYSIMFMIDVILLRSFGDLWLTKILYYLAFQSFDFWWRLFQKRVLWTKIDIYICITSVSFLIKWKYEHATFKIRACHIQNTYS